MDKAPTEAPAPAPTGESVATPNTNTEPAKAPETNSVDLHGFTQEDLAGMRTFIDNNGGWEKIKSRISNPNLTPTQMSESQNPTSQPQPQPQPQAQPVEQTQQPLPKGARTNEDLMAEFYFKTLSEKPEYAAISEDIRMGNVLKEMDNLGINYRYPNGAWNDDRINDYLKLKAQTVPAQPTSTEPNMSNAPTVDYITVGDKIESMEQAQAVFMQPGHPRREDAKAYIKAQLNPNSAVDNK